MRRRQIITLLGGAAAWPLTAYAQQPDLQPRIGVLMTVDDPAQGQARMTAFRQGLQQLGWIDGRNIRIDARWSGGDDAKIRMTAGAQQPHRMRRIGVLMAHFNCNEK
jgi:putative ABC transport system substrate-binding protein